MPRAFSHMLSTELCRGPPKDFEIKLMYREKITKGHLQNSAKLQLQMVETETNIDSPSVARGLRYFSTQES
jgi:hypothetical protein